MLIFVRFKRGVSPILSIVIKKINDIYGGKLEPIVFQSCFLKIHNIINFHYFY